MIKLPRIALPPIKFPPLGPFRSWELSEKEIFPKQELDSVVVKPLKPYDFSLVFKAAKQMEWVMCCHDCAQEKRKTPLQWNDEELCFVCPIHAKFDGAPVLPPVFKEQKQTKSKREKEK